MTSAYLNRNARAVPEHEVQEVLVVFAEKTLADPRLHSAFGRMASRANIAHRYLVPETRGRITWEIRELGFDILLSRRVPAELGRALHEGELMAAGMMQPAQSGQRGRAMSFGPGLTAETMRFHVV